MVHARDSIARIDEKERVHRNFAKNILVYRLHTKGEMCIYLYYNHNFIAMKKSERGE